MVGRVARMGTPRADRREDAGRARRSQDPPAAALGQKPPKREKPASGLTGSRGAAYPYAPWEAMKVSVSPGASLPVSEWFPTGPVLTSPHARELRVIFGGGEGGGKGEARGISRSPFLPRNV